VRINFSKCHPVEQNTSRFRDGFQKLSYWILSPGRIGAFSSHRQVKIDWDNNSDRAHGQGHWGSSPATTTGCKGGKRAATIKWCSARRGQVSLSSGQAMAGPGVSIVGTSIGMGSFIWQLMAALSRSAQYLGPAHGSLSVGQASAYEVMLILLLRQLADSSQLHLYE
jgi:hypothetical protein